MKQGLPKFFNLNKKFKRKYREEFFGVVNKAINNITRIDLVSF